MTKSSFSLPWFAKIMVFTCSFSSAIILSDGAFSASVSYEKVVNKDSCGRVSEWSSDCVKEFMLNCGFELPVLVGIEKAGITGSILLELTAEDYTLLGIDTEIEKKRWLTVDKELHKAINAGIGTQTDGSFTDLYDLRGADRAGFSRAMTFVFTFPRLSTVYYHMYAEQNGNPLLMFDTEHERSTFSWFWWVIFPEKMIADHFATFMDTNYWRAITLVLTAYLSGIAMFIRYLSYGPGGANKLFLESVGAAVGYLVWVYILWPLTPRFLCDFVFYIEPLMIMIVTFNGFFVRTTANKRSY